MRTWEAEQMVAAKVIKAGGDKNTVIDIAFTFTPAKRRDQLHRARIDLWISSAPDFGVSIHVVKPLFSRAWTIHAKGWAGGIQRWLWRGRDL